MLNLDLESKSIENQYPSTVFQRVYKTTGNEAEDLMNKDSFWKDIFIRFTKNKGAVIGLVLIVIVCLFAFIAPMVSQYKYNQTFPELENLPPRIPFVEKFGIFNGEQYGVNVYKEKGLNNVYHLFGTDYLGRDLWVRTWVGTRVSFYIAALAVLIDMLIGITYGLISGYIGGRVDNGMQRFIEILSGIPNLVIVTLLVIVLKPGIMSISIAIMITGWIGMSRVVRSQVLKLRELDFIIASKTLGSSTFQIIFKDMLPNIFGQVVVMSMFSIPNAIFYESFLAFIGLGLQPPMASLGVLINDGYKSVLVYPYMVFAPILVLATLMLSFNLVADGLRDVFDPKMKEQ